MGANVYPQQTSSASKKFTYGQTTVRQVAAIVVYMRQTRFLAKWIERQGKKPADVAKATGLTPGYISQLGDTTGKYTKEPKISTLQKIGDYLGVHYAAFEFDPDSTQGRVLAAMVEPRRQAMRGR